MKVHSEIKIAKIKELRLRGYSINEIVKELSVPKTTVWHHIKHVYVPLHLNNILQSKRGGSAIRSEKEWIEAENKARLILTGKHAKLAIAVAMLYWGEGSKKVCEIINTDPKLLQLYLKFLKEVINIHPDDIKYHMRIFTGMYWEECLDYWSKNLAIDKDAIIIRYNDGGTSGKSKYGMCRIALKKGRKVLKLMHALIRLSFSDIMGFANPVPQWIEYRKPCNIKNSLPIVQGIEQDTPNV